QFDFSGIISGHCAVREMAADPKVGRAEAMRRSMLALIDKGTPEEAHPSYWAPFVVVGEGARVRLLGARSARRSWRRSLRCARNVTFVTGLRCVHVLEQGGPRGVRSTARP